MSNALLVLWVALIAADRIDFLGGEGPFVLTPFLALTPLVLLSEGWRLVRRRGRLHWPRWGTVYVVACLGLAVPVLLSILLALEVPIAAKRGTHLLVLMGSTLAVAATLVRRPGADRILVRGAKVGLALAAAFSVWQVTNFLTGESEAVTFGVVSVELAIPAYAGIIPRLSGTVADMNRAGFLYLFYLFVLARWGGRGAGRWVWMGLALALILGTLSRSTLLAVAVVGLVAAWEGRGGGAVPAPGLVAGSVALAAVSAWMLLDPFGVEEMGRTLSPLQSRFSLEEGSTQSHFDLLARGVEEAAGSIKRALIGVGFGNAFLVLQDVFPGNRYGNFHSLYVTFLAESGVFAFLAALVLVGWPVVRGGPVRALVAGVAAYNVFYQVSSEPLLWFILAWAWLTLPEPAPAPVAPQSEEEAAAPQATPS